MINAPTIGAQVPGGMRDCIAGPPEFPCPSDRGAGNTHALPYDRHRTYVISSGARNTWGMRHAGNGSAMNR